jgi:nitrite transporter NirC
VGAAVALMISAAGPLIVSDSPWTKLIEGLVFGVALSLVIFAGSELSTGNMMTMIQGAALRRTGVIAAVAVILFSFIGNLVGSAVFAWLVHETGLLSAHDVGKPAVGGTALVAVLETKMAASGTALFFRGVLCNFLVCLAVWTGPAPSPTGPSSR